MNEMNAERIKRLKYSGSFTMTNMDGPGPLVSSVQKTEFDWLIEQAERVPKLELNFKSLQQEWVNTVKENKRLREALEFYAKDENYNVNTTNQWEPLILINQDHGEKARQALEGKRDG